MRKWKLREQPDLLKYTQLERRIIIWLNPLHSSVSGSLGANLSSDSWLAVSSLDSFFFFKKPLKRLTSTFSHAKQTQNCVSGRSGEKKKKTKKNWQGLTWYIRKDVSFGVWLYDLRWEPFGAYFLIYKMGIIVLTSLAGNEHEVRKCRSLTI